MIAADGRKVEGLDIDQVAELLQGATGSEVEVEILPLGAVETEEITLTREKIKMPAVPYSGIVGDSTAYVVLTAFTRNCAGEVRQAIKALQDSVGNASAVAA